MKKRIVITLFGDAFLIGIDNKTPFFVCNLASYTVNGIKKRPVSKWTTGTVNKLLSPNYKFNKNKTDKAFHKWYKENINSLEKAVLSQVVVTDV